MICYITEVKLMIDIQRLIKSKTAKSKKSIIGWIVAIVVGGIIAMFVFGSGTSAMGIILGIGVFVAIAVGVFFILKHIDDLPEALN